MRRRQAEVHPEYPFIGPDKLYKTVEEWRRECDARRERRRRLLARLEQDDDLEDD